MAHLRPSLEHLDQLLEPLNASEYEVAQSLSTLSDEWTVYIQPRIGQDRPDFVAIHPQFGVCAIEVKHWSPNGARRTADGVIELLAADGQWVRSPHQPRFEASRFRSNIYDQFFALPSDGTEPTEAVRSAVVMPLLTDAQAVELLDDASAHPSEQHVALLGAESLRAGIEHVLFAGGPARLRADSLVRLQQHLVPSTITSSATPPVPRSAVARVIEANADEVAVRRVRGPAGSGKSFALTGRAARLAAYKKRVLVLSFNVTLANRLSTLVGERCDEYKTNPTRVTCANFHSFCTRVVQDAQQQGIETSARKGASWPVAIVSKARQAFEAGFTKQYDAILIDEGQDFPEAWWKLLSDNVLVPGGEMLLVTDPTQDLYSKESWLDEDAMVAAGFTEPWIDMHGSYRMPSDLVPLSNDFASTHLDGERIAAEALTDQYNIVGALSGSVRRWRTVDQVSDVGTAVGREVVRLLQENPLLRPRDVAFLCEYHHDGVAAVAEIEQAGYHVHHIFSRNPDDARRRRKYRFWPDADGVKGCTVHSFKGWETPALVMGIGVETRSKRLAYVAMTRVHAASAGESSYVSVINADKRIADVQADFESGMVSAPTDAAPQLDLPTPNF